MQPDANQPLEIEIKYFISAHDFMPQPVDVHLYKRFLLTGKLELIRDEVPPVQMQFQVDTDYQHPCYDMKEKDMVLRRRSIINHERKKTDSWRITGQQDVCTFKGKAERDGAVKTRIEREFAAPDDLFHSLEDLGFSRAIEVRKYRWYMPIVQTGITLCLDLVDRLGLFAEIEIMCAPDEKEAALVKLQKFAENAGLNQLRTENLSYADLISAKTA